MYRGPDGGGVSHQCGGMGLVMEPGNGLPAFDVAEEPRVEQLERYDTVGVGESSPEYGSHAALGHYLEDLELPCAYDIPRDR